MKKGVVCFCFLLNGLAFVAQTNETFLSIISKARNFTKEKNKDSAAVYYKKLFELDEDKLHDTLKLRLADAYMLQANRERARDNVKTSAAYILKAKNIIPLNDTQRVLKSKYIGVEINRAIKNYEAARKELREIISLCNLGNYTGKYFYDSYLSLGAIFLDEGGNADSSIYYANKALPFIIAAHDSVILAKCFNNVAVAYHRKHKLGDALLYYQKALKIDSARNDYYGGLLCRGNIAQIYCDQGKYKEAISYCDHTFSLFHSDDFGSIKADLYLTKARSYLHTNEPDSSETYFEKFFSLTQELYQTEQQSLINELNTKYQTEQKEKDIALLKENAELQEKESKTKQLIIYFFIGFSILLIFTIYLSVKSYLNKKKDHGIITSQKKEVEEQKALIEEKQKEIIDSINYASRIQRALITSESYLKDHVNDMFVLYKPKDIVSGDFYWGLQHLNKFYLITADCTGHGVPGAFMSLLNISILNEVITEKKILKPDLILNEARKEIIKALNPGGQVTEGQDGMDCVLCCFDFENKIMEYAAANNSFYVVREGKIMMCAADKMAVGKSPKEAEQFTLYSVALQEGDVVYTLTDGYADQFGGPKGKKFKYKQLEEILLSVHTLPLEEQSTVLNEKFENWKGKLDQVDDVLIIGIRI